MAGLAEALVGSVVDEVAVAASEGSEAAAVAVAGRRVDGERTAVTPRDRV